MRNLQPLLSDHVVVLRAPTQFWSDSSGDAGGGNIHGLYHSDVRVLDALTLTSDGVKPEWISVEQRASTATFTGVLRHLDGEGADPRVRIERERELTSDSVLERIVLRSARDLPVRTRIAVQLRPDFSPMQHVKAGLRHACAHPVEVLGDGVCWSSGSTTAVLRPLDAVPHAGERGVRIEWEVPLAPHGSATLQWRIDLSTASPTVKGAIGPSPWRGVSVSAADVRLAHWVTRALADLDTLRMTTALNSDDEFLAAGAPWFFTLFGRDSIWAARFLLPLSVAPAVSTLRVLAALQGTKADLVTAEQPGKIMHELRSAELSLGGGVMLPPLYYGTIDATPLWICLLHDAWRWGAADDDIRALLPALEAALAWMRDHGDSDGDGFLEYIDASGHGLANQGWKDSSDSVQWRDGTLAEGPIALCEVQAYAYEAAMHGADLLEGFGRDGEEWRVWAHHLRQRFAESFWVDDPQGGRYPAVALDARKRPVDTLTSNIGHLLGTGILDAEEEAAVADRLTSRRLDSGFGLRTMSTDSAGYWPLSYHGGSVWAHDTAIAIWGLARAGLGGRGAPLIEGLLRAAERFEYRMPELYSGDAASDTSTPIPYPAACCPQAWSAAAAVAVLSAQLGLRPVEEALEAHPMTTVVGNVRVDGLRVGGRAFSVRLNDGVATVEPQPPTT